MGPAAPPCGVDVEGEVVLVVLSVPTPGELVCCLRWKVAHKNLPAAPNIRKAGRLAGLT